MYVSRSLNPAENEELIQSLIQDKSHYISKKTVQPYRLVPPTIPLSPSDVNRYIGGNGRWLTIPCTTDTAQNACFVAVLARESSEVMETQALLARAIHRGLLDAGGLNVAVHKAGKQKKRKNKKKNKKDKPEKMKIEKSKDSDADQE